MRSPRIRARLVTGAVIAFLPGMVMLAPAADAAAGPSVTGASCGETSFAFSCVVGWTGGTAPFTVGWTAVQNSNIGTTQTNQAAETSSAQGNCVPGTFFELKATITDAAGLSTSAYMGGSGRCS